MGMMEFEFVNVGLFVLATTVFFWFMARRSGEPKRRSEDESGSGNRPLCLSREKLREFNGENGKEIYVALECKIYDVSKAKDFYGPGGAYHALAGRDATRALATMSLSPSTLDNSSVADLTEKQQSTLKGWVNKFENVKKYPVVGWLVEHRDYKRNELSFYDGKDKKPIFIGAAGKVFDVSRGFQFYGPEGPYAVFAGKDASRALAKMSFDEADLKSHDLSDLSNMEKDTLDGWVQKFEMKYDCVGNILD